MSEIDPQEFGAMRARMDAMEREQAQILREIDDLSRDIKHLLALANQGKGSLWVLMALGGFAGAIITKILTVSSWLPK